MTAALLLAGAPSGASSPVAGAYHVADPRLCASPMSGGIWVERVNTGTTVCGDGAERNECYAASADLSRLRTDEKARVQLQGVIAEGRAVVRGTLVRGLVEGFPDLDAGPGLVAAGRILRRSDCGRAFVATQFFVRAG